MLSKRLTDILNALPLKNNLRILEIGCGPGALAREISKRIGNGHVLAIDRSEKAIRQAISGSKNEIETGRLSFRKVAVENLVLESSEDLFDMVIAIRVGALDGRHPEIEKQSLARIEKVLKKDGKLFIDGGKPLKEVSLTDLKKRNAF